MSTYFSKIIKAGDRNREFNFTCLPHGAAQQYSVDVPDERGQRVSFTMHQQEDGGWKTAVPTLPAWVLAAEQELSRAIEENKMEHAAEKVKSR